MEEIHAGRLARARELLGAAGVAWLWLEPSVNFAYLTGHATVGMERPMGLLLSAGGDLRLVVPAMFDDELRDVGADSYVWTDDQGPEQAAKQALNGVDTLHVQAGLPFGTATLLEQWGHVDVKLESAGLSRLREKKDVREIDRLRRAARVADDIVDWAATQAGDGVTEHELAGRMEAAYLDRAVRPWEPIVAAGANAAAPHHGGGATVVDGSEAALFDTGCVFEGYHSDITRVALPDAGHVEVRDAYAVVQAAYDAAIAIVAPGAACGDIDRAARAVIESAGFGEHFTHRTGHGVGLEIHEEPYIAAGNPKPVEEGHVFTIEPGIYVSGKFGVRFENTILVTRTGAESLNDAPRAPRFSQL